MTKQQKQCTKCKEWKSVGDFYKGRGRCKPCRLLINKDHYQHPEVKARKQKRSREYSKRPDIKEHRREYMREYCQRPEVKTKMRERTREYDQRPESKKHKREYQQRPEVKERIRIYHHNRRAKKRLMPNTLTPEQWQHALNYFAGCCAVCGRQTNDMFGEFMAAADHWIPVTYEGGDNPGTVVSNIIPLCHGLGGCNNQKRDIMPEAWLEWKFGKRKASKIMKRVQEYFDSLD